MTLKNYIIEQLKIKLDNRIFGFENKLTAKEIIHWYKAYNEHKTDYDNPKSHSVNSIIADLKKNDPRFKFLIINGGAYFPKSIMEWNRHVRSVSNKSKRLIDESIRLKSLNYQNFKNGA